MSQNLFKHAYHFSTTTGQAPLLDLHSLGFGGQVSFSAFQLFSFSAFPLSAFRFHPPRPPSLRLRCGWAAPAITTLALWAGRARQCYACVVGGSVFPPSPKASEDRSAFPSSFILHPFPPPLSRASSGRARFAFPEIPYAFESVVGCGDRVWDLVLFGDESEH